MGEDLGEWRGARYLAVLWVLALLPSPGDGILSLLSPWSCLLTVSLLVPMASGLGGGSAVGLGASEARHQGGPDSGTEIPGVSWRPPRPKHQQPLDRARSCRACTKHGAFRSMKAGFWDLHLGTQT